MDVFGVVKIEVPKKSVKLMKGVVDDYGLLAIRYEVVGLNCSLKKGFYFYQTP